MSPLLLLTFLTACSKVLTGFFTVRALSSSRSPAEQLAKLESVSLELAALERELPPSLVGSPAQSAAGEAVPTGIRKSAIIKLTSL
jgi:hypothetical protein